MTNKQLEQKVEKFLEIENYFDFIDKLDLSHLMDLVEKIGTTYETENEQIMSLMDSMKDIFQPETEEK